METGLIDNGLDFMLHAATSLWDERLSEEQRLKYSTVELFQGIELLLKARLVQEHWSLILGDPGKFAEKKDAHETYAAGDFVSVAYNAARDRLKAYCSVDIGRPADTAFGALRQLRNRYVHFVCTETEAAVMATQLRAWHHVLRFLETRQLRDLTDAHHAVLNQLKETMQKSEDFLDARLEHAGAVLEEKEKAGLHVLIRPTCDRQALVVGDGYPACHVCGDFELCPSATAETYASASDGWWEHPTRGADYQLVWCEECDWPACVPVGDKELEQLRADKASFEGPPHLCFACGQLYDGANLQRCMLCGAPYFSLDCERDNCPACEESIRERIKND